MQTSAASPRTRPPGQASALRSPPSRIRVAVMGGRTAKCALIDRLFAAEKWCRCEHFEVEADNDFGRLQPYDVIVLVDDGSSPRGDESVQERQRLQLDLFRKRRLGVLILTNRPWAYTGFSAGVVCMAPGDSLDKAQGALAALAHMRPMIRRFDKKFAAMQRLGRSLRKQFDDTDRELKLAARLQREFLPRESMRAGPLHFTTLFRPCSWVSGDIFDVFRLDETNWGFYLADAVGHGVAAGLLTMYIKHAIRPKRILNDGYELVPPSEVMAELNDLFVAQGLPDSQFITGWYGMVNTQTMVMNYAVAGHPPALLIDVNGGIRELHGDGCLLGLSAGQAFSNESLQLKPGERIFVYSDGLEPTLIAHRGPFPEMPILEAGMAEVLQTPANDLMRRIRQRIDASPGSLAHADDVSVLVMDVVGAGRPN